MFSRDVFLNDNIFARLDLLRRVCGRESSGLAQPLAAS
tara:strand:+ start:122 stop:235 length:114 start_codon:yes stop_codon:yes gene_type:complete